MPKLCSGGFKAFSLVASKSAVTLQRMASTYASACSYALKRGHVKGTLGIRRVRSTYADIRRCTL